MPRPERRPPAPDRRPRRAATVGAMLLVGLAPASAPASDTVDCFAATDAMMGRRWQQAEELLRQQLARPACAPRQWELKLSLGYVIEQAAGDAARERACEAAKLYAEVGRNAPTDALREAGAQGRARSAIACERLALGAPSEPGPSEPADGSVGLLIGAGGALVAGVALMALGVDADGDRASAEDAMEVAAARYDRAAFDAAGRRFDDAGQRATWLGISGWAAFAVAAGLGGGALWLWPDGPTRAELTAAPGGMRLRF